jgi:hypothetical protein
VKCGSEMWNQGQSGRRMGNVSLRGPSLWLLGATVLRLHAPNGAGKKGDCRQCDSWLMLDDLSICLFICCIHLLLVPTRFFSFSKCLRQFKLAVVRLLT